MGRGRPARDPSSFTEAQLRKIEAKQKYDGERYRRLSTHAKWGSVGHHVKISKKALARRKAPGHAATTRLIGVYKWNAKVKGIPFTLSREEFSALIQSPCHYCGAEPSAIKRGKDIWSPLIYNGIDRVENLLGYAVGNAVACCKTCNIAKRDLSVQEFLEWATRIYLHQREN